MANDERLTAKQFQQQDGVQDWRVLAIGASAWFTTPSQMAGAALMHRVAEQTGLLPDVDLRARGVHMRIGTTLDSPGFTRADVEQARAISAAARDLGLAADPAAAQTVQLTFDALDQSSILPFWQTALRYVPMGEEDLVDPMRRDPGIWFQQQDAPRPLRNRIHLDVSHPGLPDVEGMQAVGARPLHVEEYYGTLADPEGNEADLVPGGPLSEDPETADWRVYFGGMTFYPVSSPMQAAELAVAVGNLADDAGLQLLVDVRPDGVTIDTGKDQWEDVRFGELARRVQAAARGMGLTADTTRLRFVQIGIDAVDIPAVREFWRAVLGYEYDPRPGVTDIFDPRRLNLPIFFQQMDASDEARRKQRNRIHVDVFVPDDRAQAHIDAALAAGGRIVYDGGAPHGWTIADPEGNEIDIAVSVGREESWAAANS